MTLLHIYIFLFFYFFFFFVKGTAVRIPSDQKNLRTKMFSLNNFDLLASNMMPVNRSLPDSRSAECVKKIYPKRLPKASVIIIFHNEPLSTLLRTIWSIVNRSPSALIHEIILVDDFSSEENLKKGLNEHISSIPITINVFSTKQREGLIRARLIGAKIATGSVLIFLDAHIECTDGWIEPLLTRISSDRSVVAVPMVNRIYSNDMSFKTRLLGINGFRWTLLFNW